MYQIKLDNKIIYDIRDKNFIVENPELDLEINKVGGLNFKIYSTHPYFDDLVKRQSVLSVLRDNTVVFKGQIISDEQNIYNAKNIKCEGVLGYLNDSIVRPYTFNGTPAEHFTNLINNHNSQVTDKQKLQVGTITVTDPNDYIVRSSVNYASTWKILNEDLIDKLGGYLKVRYETDGTYVDYLEDFDDTSTQTIELGKNLIDILAKNNATEIATVVIPLGAEIENEDGTAERLNIKSVNNNLDYVINQTAYEIYGWIVAPIEKTTYDDITDVTRLKNKGQRDLDNQLVMLKSSLELNAVDLNSTDADIERFWIYEYVRFVSEVHNTNDTFLLTHIKLPLYNPGNMRITLGKETNTLTGIQLGNKQNLDSAINRVSIIEKNYQINNEKLNDLESAIEYFSVDLSQYNITIPTASDKKPLETKNYDVNFYAYYKGTQVTPNVSISGSNTGITATKTSTYLRFAVNTSTAITDALNEYTITFTYTEDGTTYTLTKVIDIALAIGGSNGTPGPQGEPGTPGTPGTSTYFYVRYSANANGNPMTIAPQSNTKYMGVASTTSSTAPTSYSAYTWSEIKGEDGQDGTPGTPGADGTSSYLHIKYSDDGGTTFTGNSGEDVGRYRGELVDTNPTDSTTPSDYKWYDMALLVEDELNEIRQEVQTNITSINQSQEEILMTALQDYVATSDFETFKNTISTQFQQTADSFNFNFNNLSSRVTNVDGDIQQEIIERNSFIRLVDGKVVIGLEGNEITLVQQNDRISFMQNNSEVAYFSNNQLYVTDAKFLNSITIGNFALKPRTNGNLSLLYVGGES